MVDWTKPLRFRDTKNLTDLRVVGRFQAIKPVIVAYKARGTDHECLSLHYENGQYYDRESASDIINVSKEKVGYCCVALQEQPSQEPSIKLLVSPAFIDIHKANNFYHLQVGMIKVTATDGKLTKVEIVND